MVNGTKPTFSVIIPTLNEQGYISNLLSDIFASSLLPKEVLIIDAGSTDATQAQATQFGQVKYLIAHPPVGFQRTLGGKKATGQILFFLDADVRIEKDFFNKVIGTMQQNSIDICCVRMVPYQSTAIIRIIYDVFHLAFFLLQKLRASGAGSCIVVKKNVFEAMGGFHGEYTYDDIEFIRRVSRRYRFATLHHKIYVSDRRFKKYGVFFVTAQYVVLSVFFSLGLFKLANAVKYSFGQYQKT